MLTHQTILITGGTGSFGHAMTRELLAAHDPKRVIIFSRDELKQFEMRRAIPDPRVDFFLGDVRDGARLRTAFGADVDVVMHAAALKQVPACEYNPFEALKTNVLGAVNVIEAAMACGVPQVLALSTDKCCAAVNAYGKTKALAESLFVRGNAYTGSAPTRFACVRYGNVIASRGSVVPLFLDQAACGFVTVTDRRMTRYWMPLTREDGYGDETPWTAPEVVLYALAHMQGGEIYVPKIPSARVLDVARSAAPGCSVRETGMRPGEKLHEVLVSADEAPQTWDLGRMYLIAPMEPSWPWTVPEGATRVPEGFAFTSADDPWPVQVEVPCAF